MSQDVRESKLMSRRQFLRTSLNVAGSVTALGILGACVPVAAPQAAPTEAPAVEEKAAAAPNEGAEVPQLEVWYDTWGPDDVWLKLWDETNEIAGVKLNVSIIPYADHETKVLTALAAGLGPDLHYNHPMYMATFAHRGLTMSLNPYIEAENYDLSRFFQPALDSLTWKGELHAFPIEYVYNVYYYNKDLIVEAELEDPLDLWKAGKWDYTAFIDYATKLSKGEGSEQQFGAGEPPKSLRLQNPYIVGHGGLIYSDDLTKVVLNTPEALKGWDFIADHVRKNWSPAVAGRDSAYSKTMTGLFNSGKLGFFNNHRAYLSSLDPDLNVGMVEMPIWPVGKPITRSIGDGFGAFARTKYPDKCWECVKYINERGSVLLVEAKSGSPIFTDYLESDEWFASLADWEVHEVWVAAAANAISDHLPPGFGEQDAIAQAAYDTIALGQKSAKEAMDAAQVEMQAVLDEKMSA